MTEEFNLSDKRYWQGQFGYFYKQEDVKEFIKRLKEEAIDGDCNVDFINKLAGEELIEEKKQ